jgi:cell division protein FtsQ
MSSVSIRKVASAPRITAREAKEVIVSQGLMKVYTFWLVLALASVFAAVNSDKLIAFVDQPIAQFNVSSAFVELDQQSVSAVLEPYIGQNFLSVDLQEIQGSLESLAWVKTAVIHRKWPDTLAVELTEQVAVANWGHDAYINGQGDVFKPEAVSRAADRPVLIGPTDASQKDRNEMLEFMASISKTIAPNGLVADQLMLNERGAWTLGLQDGPLVELGADPDQARLLRSIKTYVGLNEDAKRMVERIDARYTNGVAVRWKEMEVATGYEYSSNPLQR